MASKNRIPIKGSEPPPLPGTYISGAIERISVTMMVRRRRSRKDFASIAKEIGDSKPSDLNRFKIPAYKL